MIGSSRCGAAVAPPRPMRSPTSTRTRPSRWSAPARPAARTATYAQLLVQHFRRHIPGNPNVVIQYMVGAGGNLAPNYLHNVAPKDGTVIGHPLQDLIFNARIGIAAVKYDASKVHYLGGADVTRTTVSVWKASGIHTLEDAKQREVLMGASGRSGQTYIIPVTLNAVLGTKFKPVVGYGGINLINLAMERGEVHGQAASWPTITATKREWVEQGPDRQSRDRGDGARARPAAGAGAGGAGEIGRRLRADPAAGRPGGARPRLDRLRRHSAGPARGAARGLRQDHGRPRLSRRRQEAQSAGQSGAWQEQQKLAKQILATPDATVARLKGILGL